MINLSRFHITILYYIATVMKWSPSYIATKINLTKVTAGGESGEYDQGSLYLELMGKGSGIKGDRFIIELKN